MQHTSNQQRTKNGVERILGNPSLREHLDDDQAEKLFEWAFLQIEQYVPKFESVSNEDADPAIEKFVSRIIVLMRSLNLLTYQLDHEIRDDMSQPACEDFLQGVTEFKDQNEQAVMLLQTAVHYPANWSAQSAFDFLFSFIELGEID